MRVQPTPSALSLLVAIGAALAACGDDKNPDDFDCDCLPGELCRDGQCIPADALDDTGGDAGDQGGDFIDNPDCPGSGLVLSEVLFTPSSGQPEFIEVAGPADRSLEGFRLVGVNGNNGDSYMDVTLAGSLGPDGRFLIASAQLEGADQLSDDLVMQNGPDSVQLLDCSGQVVDALGYGQFAEGNTFAGEGSPAQIARQGESLARCAGAADTQDNAADFHVATPPTPNAENANFADAFACTPCIDGTFDDEVTISEVLYHPEGAGTVSNEFLELRATPGLDLFGLQVQWINGTNGEPYASLDLDAVVGEDGLFVIGGAAPDAALPEPMQNGPDGIRLVDCAGTTIDEIGYGDFSEVPVLGEGVPAPASGQGNSLSRCSDGGDSGDNSLDFHATNPPTPGEPNANFVDLLVCGGTGCAVGILDGRVFINEVRAGEDGFVELRGQSRIGLGDARVELLDASGTVVGSVNIDDPLDAGGYLTLPTADLVTTGGAVRLIDCLDAPVDALAWGTLSGSEGSAEAPTNSQSLARCPGGTDTDNNDADFKLVSEPTPGADNTNFVDPEDCGLVPCVPGALAGQLVINELLYDPVESDTRDTEFLELRGTAGASLADVRLDFLNGGSANAVYMSITLTGRVGSDQLFIVGGPPETRDFSLPATIQNSPDSIILYDCSGAQLDAIGYGVFEGSATSAGEGSAAPKAIGGRSLARCPAETLGGADSDDNVADFHVAVSPTPGSINTGIGPACGEFVCEAGALTGVVVNEVRPGTGGFIELRGPIGRSLNGATLEGLDASGAVVATFELGLADSIDAAGFRSYDTGALGAAGGTVRLRDCAEATVDAVAWGSGSGLAGEGTAAAAPASGQSLGRCPAGTDSGNNANDFKLMSTPSPGAANAEFVTPAECGLSECVPGALDGRLIINELLHDPAGSDTTEVEFIELRGDQGLDLTGVHLSFYNAEGSNAVYRTITLSGLMPADELFVIGGPSATRDLALSGLIQNGPDSVRLFDCNGDILDALAYGNFTAGVAEPLGELTPAGNATSGRSLARCPEESLAVADTGNNSEDFKVAESPTPGAANNGIGPACGGTACTGGLLAGHVRINEVRPGSSGFVELAGDEGTDLSAALIEISDGAGNIVDTVELTGTDVIGASGLLNYGTTAVLAAGGTVRLLDCDNQVVDAVAWGAGADLNGEGAPAAALDPDNSDSLARCPGAADTNVNADDFKVSTSPTPNAANAGFAPGTCTACNSLAGLVVINEFNPNELGSESTANLSFVELRGVPSTPLTGARLQLVEANGSVRQTFNLTDTTVPADGLYVVAEDDVPNLDQTQGSLDIQTGPDVIRLLDDCDAVVDAVGFGTFGETDPVNWEGTSIADGDPGETSSLARRPGDLSAVDTNDNAADFCVLTPASGGGVGNAGLANPEEASAEMVCPGE